MRVRFTPEAVSAIREKREWWSQHRDKAPELLLAELTTVVAKLRSGADQERRLFGVRRGRQVWRLLMPRSKLHVYYRRDDDGDVEVLLVWNAVAGTPPPLSL